MLLTLTRCRMSGPDHLPVLIEEKGGGDAFTVVFLHEAADLLVCIASNIVLLHVGNARSKPFYSRNILLRDADKVDVGIFGRYLCKVRDHASTGWAPSRKGFNHIRHSGLVLLNLVYIGQCIDIWQHF